MVGRDAGRKPDLAGREETSETGATLRKFVFFLNPFPFFLVCIRYQAPWVVKDTKQCSPKQGREVAFLFMSDLGFYIKKGTCFFWFRYLHVDRIDPRLPRQGCRADGAIGDADGDQLPGRVDEGLRFGDDRVDAPEVLGADVRGALRSRAPHVPGALGLRLRPVRPGRRGLGPPQAFQT